MNLEKFEGKWSGIILKLPTNIANTIKYRFDSEKIKINSYFIKKCIILKHL
jgi:hypothetical protein